MSIWERTGQPEASKVLRAAAADAPTGGPSMTHAWLLTGPAGSGRSTLAYVFAAALLSAQAEPDEATLRLVEARTHPDLIALTTEGVVIRIESVREAVARSHMSPSAGRLRVVVVEDADRMTESTSNLLLKEIEEPIDSTVWILCAPSEADMLPTIRSRVRTVRLAIPAVTEVARILEERLGVPPQQAESAARLAQSHVGMALRLASSEDARARREESILAALNIHSARDAVEVAARLEDIAKADSAAITEERDQHERDQVLRSLGVEPGQAVPPALRAQVKALEEDQKRRATRSVRDGVDRILTDIGSVLRDVLLTQLHSGLDIINVEYAAQIQQAADRTDPQHTLQALDALSDARERIARNVSIVLALEAFLVTLRPKGLVR